MQVEPLRSQERNLDRLPVGGTPHSEEEAVDEVLGDPCWRFVRHR